MQRVHPSIILDQLEAIFDEELYDLPFTGLNGSIERILLMVVHQVFFAAKHLDQ
jgi:hypothetical protein